MYDLITIGDISIDLYYKGDALTEKENRFALAIGGKYQADFFKESLGGGAANVAVGVSKHGYNTAVIGIVGENPFKQIIMQKLYRRMVSTELLIVQKEYINISTILLNKNGERSIIHYSTPHVTFGLSDLYYEKIKHAKAVYLGNTGNTSGITVDEKIRLAEYIFEKKIPLFLNLSTNDCRTRNAKTEKLISFAHVFFLNGHEYSELTKKKYSQDVFNDNLLATLPFFKGVLIITDAENGSYGYTKDALYRQKAYKPRQILDTTGAGDGFTAGFISEYLKTRDIQLSMKQGSQYAMHILEKVSAQ